VLFCIFDATCRFGQQTPREPDSEPEQQLEIFNTLEEMFLGVPSPKNVEVAAAEFGSRAAALRLLDDILSEFGAEPRRAPGALYLFAASPPQTSFAWLDPEQQCEDAECRAVGAATLGAFEVLRAFKEWNSDRHPKRHLRCEGVGIALGGVLLAKGAEDVRWGVAPSVHLLVSL